MLKQLRSRKLMKRIMIATIVLVIPSFVFFYGWSQKQQSAQRAENYIVRTKSGWWPSWDYFTQQQMGFAANQITRTIYSLAAMYNQYLDWRNIRDRIPPQDIAFAVLNNEILLNVAEQNDFYTSEEEVISRLQAMFPNNWRLALNQISSMMGISGQRYLQDERVSLTIQKARREFLNETKLSLYEIWQEFLIAEEQLKIDYVKCEINDYFDRIQVSDEETTHFYEAHKEDYRIPTQVRYEYIAVLKSDLREKVEVSEEEITSYYDEHKSAFMNEEKSKVRHILFNLTDDMDKEDRDDVKTTATKVYKEAKVSEDFAALADTYSEDLYNTDPQGNKQGGDIGWISARTTRYGPEFPQKVLPLAQDEISTPLLSSMGYHIVKVEEAQEETTKTLEEASAEIGTLLKDQKAQELFDREGARMGDARKKFTTLEAISKALDLEINQSDLVNQETSYLPRIGSLDLYKIEMRQLMIGQVSPIVFSTPRAHFILRLAERVKSHVPVLSKVRERVIDELKRTKALEMAQQEAEAIAAQTTDSDALKALAEEKGLTFESAEEVTRLNGVPGLAMREFARETLGKKEKSINVSPLGASEQYTTGYVVWYLKEKKEPTLKEFNEKLPDLQRELLFLKHSAIVDEYLLDQRRAMTIDVNPNFRPEKK